MKYYSLLMVFLAMTMSGAAGVRVSDPAEIGHEYVQDLDYEIGQEDSVTELESSCYMSGKIAVCYTTFYWKGHAFQLLEGRVYKGSKITLVDSTDGLQFNFLDEDSNPIKASLVF